LLQSKGDYTFTVQSIELANLTDVYNSSVLGFTFLASNDTAWKQSRANVTGALSAAKQNVTGAIAFLERLIAASTVNKTVEFSKLSSGTKEVVSLAGLPLNFIKNSTGKKGLIEAIKSLTISKETLWKVIRSLLLT
jgi:hypothetical protein